jgi:hypothetical protein
MADDADRAAVARRLVSMRYPINNPELDVSKTLNDTFEQIAAADFYNGPAAKWVHVETAWEWLPVQFKEFAKVKTVRDMGKLCFVHLKVKPVGPEAVMHPVFDEGNGGDDA